MKNQNKRLAKARIALKEAKSERIRAIRYNTSGSSGTLYPGKTPAQKKANVKEKKAAVTSATKAVKSAADNVRTKEKEYKASPQQKLKLQPWPKSLFNTAKNILSLVRNG